MKVRFTPTARRELSEASDFYDKRKSNLGSEFLEEVGRAIALIKQYPKAAPLLYDITRQRRVDRFPYGLVHVVRDTDVVIIAVAHLKRKPSYWHKRLKDMD